MNTNRLLALAAAFLCTSVFAGPFQTVSVPDPGLIPASAGADSLAPMMTPDGRYVVFSSTAANLATNANGAPLSPTFPATLNVFLRDRTARTTTLISGNEAHTNGLSGDAVPDDISTNGQFVAFETRSFVATKTNYAGDIFQRDTVNGTTTLISVAPDGDPGNGISRSAVMTPDGRYIAFVSAATNLVENDSNNIPDVFLRDTWSNTTVLISVGAMATTNNAPFLNTSESPEITPDGRYVAFFSTATNLVPGIINPSGEIYLRDTTAGTTICASVDAHAIVTNTFRGMTNNISYDHCISRDGQFVAYQATATQSVPNGGLQPGIVLRYNVATATTDIIDTNAFSPMGAPEEVRTLDMTPDGRYIVYIQNGPIPGTGPSIPPTCIKVWDAQTGISTLIITNINGLPSTNYICDAPSIDPTGRFVTFISNAPDLVTNTVPPGYHCYIHDLQSNTTTLVDANTNGATAILLPTTFPRPSADARYIAFQAFDYQLVPGDNNHAHDVFVRDMLTGNIDLISPREATLAPPATAANFSALSPWSVSGDGRFVAFSSLAENLVTNDNNNTRDVFVRDLLTGTTRLVSVSSNGVSANSVSSEPSISADGRYVAFSSYATDIFPVTNHWQYVFVADLQTGSISLASQNPSGVQAHSYSFSPQISADGNYLLFHNQLGGAAENVYFRDMQSSNVYALTTSAFTNAAMTHNGRYVVYAGTYSGSTGTWLWSSATATRTLLLTNTIGGGLAVSEDGNYIAYISGVTLHLLSNGVDTPIGTVTANAALPRYTPHFGGGLLVYGNTTDLFTYDLAAHTTTLVTHAYNSTQSAGGVSDFPDIGSDGRYIIYRSTSSNLVGNMQFPDTNGTPRLFAYDTQTGNNMILSTGASPTSGGNFVSFAPSFAADGHTVVFSSFASDLVNSDFNQGTDVFEFAFLFAQITVSPNGVTISWPAAPGQTYHVQYKDYVDSYSWQNLSGPITITGNRASITDTSPSSDLRVYRVAAF